MVVTRAQGKAALAASGRKDDAEPKFTHFASLPGELQLRIWRFAAFVPRDVYLWAPDIQQRQARFVFQLSCSNPIPPMMQTCIDARNEARKVYPTIYLRRKHQKDTKKVNRATRRIYLHPSIDRICLLGAFWWHEALQRVNGILASYGIKRMAVEYDQGHRTLNWVSSPTLVGFSIPDRVVRMWLLPKYGVEEFCIFHCSSEPERSDKIKLVDFDEVWVDKKETRRMARIVPTVNKRWEEGLKLFPEYHRKRLLRKGVVSNAELVLHKPVLKLGYLNVTPGGPAASLIQEDNTSPRGMRM